MSILFKQHLTHSFTITAVVVNTMAELMIEELGD